MSKFYKILPYLVILGMAIFLYVQFTENSELKDAKDQWEEKEQKYKDEQQYLLDENGDKDIVIDMLKEDRINLDAELDSIKKLRKNEKPLTPYTPVGDDDLLDSIIHYARK